MTIPIRVARGEHDVELARSLFREYAAWLGVELDESAASFNVRRISIPNPAAQNPIAFLASMPIAPRNASNFPV